MQPSRRGACGFVQLALDTATGEAVAVKFISRTSGFNAQAAGRELLNQRACAGHRHVVQLQVPCCCCRSTVRRRAACAGQDVAAAAGSVWPSADVMCAYSMSCDRQSC
jgi:hypothetical protein